MLDTWVPVPGRQSASDLVRFARGRHHASGETHAPPAGWYASAVPED